MSYSDGGFDPTEVIIDSAETIFEDIGNAIADVFSSDEEDSEQEENPPEDETEEEPDYDDSDSDSDSDSEYDDPEPAARDAQSESEPARPEAGVFSAGSVEPQFEKLACPDTDENDTERFIGLLMIIDHFKKCDESIRRSG